MDRKLKDYKPTDVLISYDSLQNILQNYEQRYKAEIVRDKNKELAISTSVTFIANVISGVTVFSASNIFIRIVIVMVSVALFIYTIICASHWHEAHNEIKHNIDYKGSLDSLIANKVKESMRYTAIVRVVYKHKDEIRYLVGEDYFLPHCNMNSETSVYNQKENILQSLYDDFGIQEKNILNIKPIDDQVYFSIKPIHGRIQMNAYVFYDVEIKIQAKKKLIESNDRRNWISLQSMRTNPNAIGTNKDVIDLLEDFSKPKESFVNILGNFNIIWNITSHCDYNCAICATFDEDRKELSSSEKLKVLNNIFTAKSVIKTLDFAGGDPLHSDETINIIQTAIGQLGTDKVSITTTGSGISKLVDNKFTEQIKHCEITIDAAHSNLCDDVNIPNNVSRNEADYCSTNIEQINVLLEYAESLTINIPIINDDLNDKEIENLISKIEWIKERNPKVDIDTLLIRLMPVGKLAIRTDKDLYEKYNPIEVAKKIKEKLEGKNIVCRLHCSFRVLPYFNDEKCSNHCSMLENKIGIDCAGNVFACAWGGYLLGGNPPIKSPFYLGNLTQISLKAILEGGNRTKYFKDIFREIDSGQKRHFCSVVSYYANGQMFKDFDYLSPKDNL